MYTLNVFITLLILLLYPKLIQAQAPNIVWEKSLGGANWDFSTSIDICSDSGYIVSGITRSVDGDVIGHNSADSTDAWIVKLDVSGNILWQKVIGGSYIDYLNSIQETFDNGFISVGYTYSNDGDVTGNHGDRDIWIVKQDSLGNIQWQKCYGGTGQDEGFSIIKTTDRNYIISGKSSSSGGNMTCGIGYYKFWILKIDSVGNELWQKCYGGSNYNEAYSVAETSDGGYIVAGNTASNDGDVTGNHGGLDYWVVKLDYLGNLQWQKCFGGTGNDYARKINQTTDGGFIVVGFVDSNNGDVTGNHGGRDYWIVKLDNLGNLQWQKCFGGSNGDEAYSIQKTNNGFTIAGFTSSQNGDVTGNSGGGGCWILQIDSLGTINWEKYLKSGGGGGYGIKQINDGGFIISSAASIIGSDATGNHGSLDFWIVRLGHASVGFTEMLKYENDIKVFPNPANESIVVDFKNTNKNINGFQINLLNFTGQIISTETIIAHSTKIRVSDIKTKGIYLVRISDNIGNIIYAKKIVIQ